MMKVYVLYDCGTCEIIRAFNSMEKAMVAAMNRLTFYRHTCVGFEYGDEYTAVKYIDHDTGVRCALTVQTIDMEGN